MRLLNSKNGRLNCSMALIILILSLNACAKKDGAIINPEIQDSTSVNLSKEKIKSFWSAYRAAQDHRARKEYKEAKQDYLLAISIDNRHEDALFNLGNVCYELGDYAEAKESWKKLLAVNPLNARAHFQLGNLYLRMESPEFYSLDSAEMEFLKAVDLNRAITGPRLHLGQIELIRGNLSKASEYFNHVTGTNERSVEAYFHLGYIQWKRGNLSEAKEKFSHAIEISEPEKAIEGVLSEGDTRKGASMKRPTNQSIFEPFFYGLNGMDSTKTGMEMNVRYEQQDAFLDKLFP